MTKQEIQEKNDKIVKTVFKIMDVLHAPKTGFNALQSKLIHTNRAEYEKAKEDILNKMTAKYGATPETSYNEKVFMLTGQDIMENHIQFSCGNVAKAFCYVNSKLPPNERLNLKIMLTVDTEHFVDAMSAHTVPVVVMADGKYRAIDPAVTWTESHICGPFIPDEIKIGKTIHHILPKIRNREYKIVKIVTWHELETSLSKFKNFLSATSVRHGKTKLHCATLSYVLQNLDRSDSGKIIYNFCDAIKRKTSLPVGVLRVKDEKDKEFSVVVVKLDGDFYKIAITQDYLILTKINITRGKTFTIGTEPKIYTTIWAKTPMEYIQWAESSKYRPMEIHKVSR